MSYYYDLGIIILLTLYFFLILWN